MQPAANQPREMTMAMARPWRTVVVIVGGMGSDGMDEEEAGEDEDGPGGAAEVGVDAEAQADGGRPALPCGAGCGR